jgi:hypothetical protein
VSAPVTLPAEARLAALAAWDMPLLRGAVVTLAAVEGRLTTWRARLGAVARSLESAESWSGPAAASAAGTVFDLDTVAAAVDAALARSLAGFERMADEADAAQELAARALVLARTLDGGVEEGLGAHSRLTETVLGLLPEAATPDPGPALAAAEAALAHAAAAAAAATAAGVALEGLGVRDALAPADFWGLAAQIQLVGPVRAPQVPDGRGAEQDAADWWVALSTGAQLAAIRGGPAAIGALDGVPAWARDRANRLLLDRALHDRGLSPSAADAARAVAERIGIEEAAGRRVQLHLLDLDDDEVVLAIGDLDTADAVGLMVPGVFNTPGDDLHGLASDARAVAAAARAAGPGLEVATVVWLGYRTPGNPWEMATRFSAWRGGAALRQALDGMAASRVASGAPLPRTTVLAHSYGTVVLDEAADEPGRLAADAVVLLGSPGMEPTGAAGLEAPEVYDTAAVGDPVSWLGWFGTGTYAPHFGSTALPGDPRMGHSDYYDPAYPTLAAIGEVVAGARTPD